MEIETVIGDMAYSEKENIQYANQHELQLIAKLNLISHWGLEKKKMNLNLIKLLACM